MRNTNKKGFTIVELVIVVAVIAILAAVLIPTFTGIINKAKLSSDQQAVRNLNTALATSVDKPETLRELADVLKEAGYNTKDGFNSLLSDYAIFWYNTDKYNVIVLAKLADGTIYAPAEDKDMVAAFKADYAAGVNFHNLADLAAEVFVGDKNYATLVEAVKTEFETKDEVVIDLYNDTYFAEPVAVPTGKTLTLNLNGHTISSIMTEKAGGALIENKGTLIIDDKTGTGKITTAATNPDMRDIPHYANNTINNRGNLVLEGGIIENTTDGPACYPVDNYNGATFTMNGGKISAVACGIRMFGGTTNVTINGGEINGGRRGIWVQVPGSNPNNAPVMNLTINGGTITGSKMSLYVYTFGDSLAGVSVSIKGGTFTNDVAFGGADSSKFDYQSKENISITGGTFNGKLGRYLENNGWEDIAKP